jgi:hypothetical protein
MTFSLKAIFQRDEQYEGVRRINIYLLRLVFILMFFVLGKDTWTHILTHRGSWEPDDAMAWCVWTAFATLAGLGIFRPLKMLPILLLEICPDVRVQSDSASTHELKAWQSGGVHGRKFNRSKWLPKS